MHCVARQNKLETPKEKDEVNKREVHECDVRTHDPDVMVVPPTSKSTFKPTGLVLPDKTISFPWPPPELPLRTRWTRTVTLTRAMTVVYYESIKRELKTKLMYECRCDERLTNEIEESIRLACTVLHDKTN